MHRLRNLIMAAAVAALAISALGVPAAASHGKGTIVVVNGIPGVKVDICIKTRPGKFKEIKSGLPYGGKVFRTMHAGSKLLKVFKKDPRRCRGAKLAQKRFALAAAGLENTPDSDLTLVVTRNAPKVIVFDNVFLGMIPPIGADLPNAWFAFGHAADLGGVNFLFTFLRDFEPELPIGPSADPIWREGDRFIAPAGGGTGMVLRATRPGKTKTIAQSRVVPMEVSWRYEWYLLGTKPKNAKFVVISRAVSKYGPITN